MKYSITGKGDCQLVFAHYPGLGGSVGTYSSEIRLELAMLRVSPAEAESRPVDTHISFLDTIPINVVTEEKIDKVTINLPINSFDSFYKLLCEGLNENKYKIKLETIGRDTMTLANFHFIPAS